LEQKQDGQQIVGSGVGIDQHRVRRLRAEARG
jgi:hypothetical protein